MAKILIVDDDQQIIDYLMAVLLPPGHDLKAENSANRALLIMPDFHPDLIITDVFMPEMDGFEFIKRIRRLDKEVNILAISAGSKGYSNDRTLATAKDF